MYVRALLRQLTHMSLQISGGFSAEHMIEYLELPIRSLGLGTFLVPRVLVDRASWQAITNRARAFVDYAANPHAYAAQFIAMMGIGAPASAVNPLNPRIANIPTMPVPPNMGGMIDPTLPDMPQVASRPELTQRRRAAASARGIRGPSSWVTTKTGCARQTLWRRASPLRTRHPRAL